MKIHSALEFKEVVGCLQRMEVAGIKFRREARIEGVHLKVVTPRPCGEGNKPTPGEQCRRRRQKVRPICDEWSQPRGREEAGGEPACDWMPGQGHVHHCSVPQLPVPHAWAKPQNLGLPQESSCSPVNRSGPHAFHTTPACSMLCTHRTGCPGAPRCP